MKKLLLILFGLLLLPLASSAFATYDNFQDGVINWTFWKNYTGHGAPYASTTETANQLRLDDATGSMIDGTFKVWAEKLLPQYFVKSMNVTTTWNIGCASGSVTMVWYVYNQSVFTKGCPDNTGTTTLSLYNNRNGTFRVSNSTAWTTEITPSGLATIFDISSSGGSTGTYTKQLYVNEITYEYYGVWNNLTSPISGSSILSYNTNFTINNTAQQTFNLSNVTYYFYHSNNSLAYSQLVNISNKMNVTSINRTFSINDDYIWFANTCGTNSTTSECYLGFNSTFKNLLINNVTYNSTTQVTYTEGYILNFSLTDPASLNSINFIFNNVSQSAPYTISGNNIIVQNSKAINSAGNNIFYWNLIISGRSINTSLYTQTASAISPPLVSGTSCVAGGYSLAYNFSVYDESNLTQLSSTTFDYLFYYGLNNGYSQNMSGSSSSKSLYVCFNFSASNTWKVGYSEINYMTNPAGTYPLRKYLLFQNSTITNYTNNVSLYSILNSEQTTFDLSVIERSSLLPYKQYYISLLRWYPSTNEYKIVDMGKLDDSGKSPIHVIVEDVDYRIAVYESDGDLVHLATPKRLVCLVSPCTYTLSIEEESLNLNELLDIEHLLSFNETTNIWTFIWNDPSQRTTFMNLTIYQDFGDASRAICSIGSSAYTGVITCNTSGYDGKLRGEVTRSASPPILIAQYITQIVNSVFKSNIGLFISLLIAIPAIFALAYVSPIFAVIIGIVALIPALYLGTISYAVIGALAVLGGVILHVLNRI